MIHHTQNAIIIQGKVYELTKLESRIEACNGCALFSQCSEGHVAICQVVHNVNNIWGGVTYNYKELKLKLTKK